MKPKVPAILMLLGGLLILLGDTRAISFDWFAPSVRPINAEGFRVMLVYEDATLSQMPEEQKSVIFSTEVRRFLLDHCEKANGSPDFRIVTDKTDLSNDQSYWKEAFARPRKENPWLMISGKSKGGFEGKMPQSVDSMLSLLKKHSGGK
jgi:hypothetical protein